MKNKSAMEKIFVIAMAFVMCFALVCISGCEGDCIGCEYAACEGEDGNCVNAFGCNKCFSDEDGCLGIACTNLNEDAYTSEGMAITCVSYGCDEDSYSEKSCNLGCGDMCGKACFVQCADYKDGGLDGACATGCVYGQFEFCADEKDIAENGTEVMQDLMKDRMN